eukprot:gene2323-2549_t
MLTFVTFLACWVAFILADPVVIPPRYEYPQIISHRGACGYLPEHSLQAYQLAMELGTDYVETDLCLSKDGVFVAMHDLTLDNTTNVEDFPEWTDRKTTKKVEGGSMTGYFVSDFTLAELKSLRLKQRLYERNTLSNLFFSIPTLQEIISLVQSFYLNTKRSVGLYIEIKKPSYSRAMGFPLEDMLLANLSAAGYDVYRKTNPPPASPSPSRTSAANMTSQVLPVIYECFDEKSLLIMRERSSLPLVQLLEKQSATFWNTSTMNAIARYSDAIGPEKSFLEDCSFEEAKAKVDMIYGAGLRIHPWTFRADQDIGEVFQGDFEAEETFFYCCLGIDAFFTEFPDQARDLLALLRSSSFSPCPIDCAAYRR